MYQQKGEGVRAMTQTTVKRDSEGLNESVTLHNGTLNLRWHEDGQLVLRNPFDTTTRIAGGPLVELTPLAPSSRARTLGLGRDPLGVAALEPEEVHDAHGPGIQLVRRFPIAVQHLEATWTVRVYDEHAWARMDLTVRNTGSLPLSIGRLFPYVSGPWWESKALLIGNKRADLAVYKQGWQSWSYAGGMPLGQEDFYLRSDADLPWYSPAGSTVRQPIRGTVDVVSDGMALLGHPAQREALLLGFLSADRWLGQIYVQRHQGAVAACALLDGFVLEPGMQVSAPPLLVAIGAQEHLPSMYSEAVGREQGARHTVTIPTCWSGIDASSAASTVATAQIQTVAAVAATVPVDVIQVEERFQTDVGDWLGGDHHFARTVTTLAAQIRAVGCRPGLWLAPFAVPTTSRLVLEHPDWFVRDARGTLVAGGERWGVRLVGLDTTHPDAQSWLRHLLTTIVRDWGIEHMTLDVLVNAALPGRRFDALATRASALRSGLQLIREVVGEGVFLVGSGCPLLSAVGLVDAMQIGPESALHWEPQRHDLSLIAQPEGHGKPALRGALRNTLTRAWMHPTQWISAPDPAPLYDHAGTLTLDEMRAYITAIGLTGGMLSVASPPDARVPERLELAAKILPPLRERATPLSVFGPDIPERMLVQVIRPWGRWLLVGLFNSHDEARIVSIQWEDLGLAPATYHAMEFWSQQYLGASSRGVTQLVTRHGAAVLAIHPRAFEPQVLSTSFHVGQGAVEIAEWSVDRSRHSVSWVVRLGRAATGSVTLALPVGTSMLPGGLISTAANAHARVHHTIPSIVVVTAHVDGDARFTLVLSEPAE